MVWPAAPFPRPIAVVPYPPAPLGGAVNDVPPPASWRRPRPDFMAVVSLERTGGTSVYRSLRSVYGPQQLRHVHYLDGVRHALEGDPAEDAVQEHKREREIETGRRLRDGRARRVVFSMLRDPFERLVSGLWYGRGEVFQRYLDPRTGAFDPRVEAVLRRPLDNLLDRQRGYGAEVYETLGLPWLPGPGRHEAEGGLTAFVLRFERLAQDFHDATRQVFGLPVPLMHLNAADRFGDADSYRAFRRLCEDVLAEERRELDGMRAGQQMGAPLAAELSQAQAPDASAGLFPPELLSDPEAARSAAAAWRKTARTLMAEGDSPGELEAWRRVLEATPGDVKALSRLVTLLHALGYEAEAKAAKETLRGLTPPEDRT